MLLPDPQFHPTLKCDTEQENYYWYKDANKRRYGHTLPVSQLDYIFLWKIEIYFLDMIFMCNVSEPSDVFTLRYMRIVRSSLICITGWPLDTNGVSTAWRLPALYRSILIMLTILNIISTIIYLKTHMDTDLGQTYLNTMMASVCLQRLFLPFQKKFYLVVNKFISEFHLMHFKHKTEYSTQVYQRVNKICSVLALVSCVQVGLAVNMYNLIPLYINYNSGMFTDQRPLNRTFLHSIDYELPFDQYNDHRGYLIIFFYDWFTSYNVATSICMYDLLVFIIVFHIWGHLNILIHDLKYFSVARPQYTDQLSSVQSRQEDIMVRLKDIIGHHTMIKEFMSRTSEAFSTTLCFYLMFHQLSGCVLLLKCYSLDPAALVRYGLVTLIIFQQLIETSVIFELICSKGDMLADLVYGLPWERMVGSNRRIVLTFLCNVQTSLALKAGGMVPVGVMTMSAIIRTSCSYFLMLRTLNQ